MTVFRIVRAVVALSALLHAAAGCGGTAVRRMDAGEVIDLSGRWNDTDSRLVAEEMVSDSLSQAWLAKATTAKGKSPTLVVGRVRNMSNEHIAVETFIEDLQRALINSGKVEFVAAHGERGDVRDERLDQDLNASEATRKEHGQESGADFILTGAINSIEDRDGGEAVTFYQINLKLLNLTSNQISWNGQKKIKKYVKRASVSW